jgi:redox-sensitive bicupin YhaK (pirin superfamily)
MSPVREIREIHRSRPTIEGAGVHLRRAFGFGQERSFDPFLMLDDFRGDDPRLYSAGFPWHPHRGIETITYLLEGRVAHSDSMGHEGLIGPGDVQWMTAGSGVIHQEMPHGDETGRMGGFQLWANLPATDKMIDARYCGIEAGSIPVARDQDACVRIICGSAAGATGPVSGVAIDPQYLDVEIDPAGSWIHETPLGHTVFAYLFEGDARFGTAREPLAADTGVVALLTDGSEVRVEAGPAGARFLLVGGRPLGEPIAWGGPIVMNTREELEQAFAEYHDGTFVKHRPRGR